MNHVAGISYVVGISYVAGISYVVAGQFSANVAKLSSYEKQKKKKKKKKLIYEFLLSFVFISFLFHYHA